MIMKTDASLVIEIQYVLIHKKVRIWIFPKYLVPSETLIPRSLMKSIFCVEKCLENQFCIMISTQDEKSHFDLNLN